MVYLETIMYLKKEQETRFPYCAKTMCSCTDMLLSAVSITVIKIINVSLTLSRYDVKVFRYNEIHRSFGEHVE